VDDDEQVRHSTSALLDELGYECFHAGSGQEALDLLRKLKQIDVLLTDYAMPGMTGIELIKHGLKLRPELNILLMTGYADATALPNGSLKVLNKPFTLTELNQAITEVISHRQDISLI
jgi:CheY-like chemotaxis protein